MQRALALLGLIVLGPVILVLAVAVRLTSPGPAFHRATRVRPGGTFTLYKLRSMTASAASTGPGVTAAGDPRITRLGRVLRRTRLDELPQLWNVVRGDMALVGPRPEDPRYVDRSDPLHATVFGALPGITGPTALAYHDEEARLAQVATEAARDRGSNTIGEDEVDAAYRTVVLPAKLRMDADYLASRTFGGDVRILLATARLGLTSSSRGRASPGGDDQTDR